MLCCIEKDLNDNVTPVFLYNFEQCIYVAVGYMQNVGYWILDVFPFELNCVKKKIIIILIVRWKTQHLWLL